MSKAGRRIIFFIIVLFGLVVFNYPNIATFVNNLTANREISEYQESIQEADTTWIEHEMELAYAYNQSLPMSFPADPFSQSNIRSFTGTEFEHFDMVQDGAVIGYVEVPSINIYLPVYYGTSDEVLEKGLGLVENTSLPVGGEGTHSVISGHTGMASRKLFTDLNLVKEGEEFFLHVLDQHFAYKVNQIKVVLPHETQESHHILLGATFRHATHSPVVATNGDGRQKRHQPHRDEELDQRKATYRISPHHVLTRHR